MTIKDDIAIFLLSTASLLLSSCQEQPVFEKNYKSSASINAEGSNDAINDEEDWEVSEPVSVAGAFLYCAMDSNIEVSVDGNSGLGCRLTDENNRPVVLKKDFEVTTTLTSADGNSRELELSTAKSIYWHWIYEAPTNELAGGTIEMFTDVEGVIWGDTKIVKIVQADNNLQEQLELLYMMIEEHEASLLELQADLDSATLKLNLNKSLESQASDEKDKAMSTLQSATSQHNLAKDEYDQAVLSVTTANNQLSNAVIEMDEATSELEAAQAALATAEQDVLNAQNPAEMNAAMARRDQAATNVQTAQTNLTNANDQVAELEQLLTNATSQRNSAKTKMDTARSNQTTARSRYNERLAFHNSAVLLLERTTQRWEQAAAARDKVALALEELRAEAQRLEMELGRL